MKHGFANAWKAAGVDATEKNVEQKLTPYLIPYEQLSGEIKELDRDTIRNIPALLKMIGMKAVQREVKAI